MLDNYGKYTNIHNILYLLLHNRLIVLSHKMFYGNLLTD